jgi:hypothetical protein
MPIRFEYALCDCSPSRQRQASFRAGRLAGRAGAPKFAAGDRAAAFGFYSKRFGWKVIRDMDMGDLGTYWVFCLGDAPDEGSRALVNRLDIADPETRRLPSESELAQPQPVDIEIDSRGHNPARFRPRVLETKQAIQ